MTAVFAAHPALPKALPSRSALFKAWEPPMPPTDSRAAKITSLVARRMARATAEALAQSEPETKKAEPTAPKERPALQADPKPAVAETPQPPAKTEVAKPQKSLLEMAFFAPKIETPRSEPQQPVQAYRSAIETTNAADAAQLVLTA
jgi:hypothetical protein